MEDAMATKTFELTEVPDNYRHRLLAQYDREAFAGSSFATDILMYLDASKVLALRKEFLSKDDGLSMHEFVFVMKSFLMGGTLDADNGMANMSETVLVSNLCELFEQIDINGDGTMEWDEFTSFIVDNGMHGAEADTYTINQYHPLNTYLDLTKHFAPIERMSYLDQLDRIAVCEQGNNVVKIYDASCHLKATIEREDGFFMCTDHIPEMNQIVACSSDLQVSFYDESTYKLHKCFHCPSSQMCMTWCPEARSLFTAGVSGVVYAWDAQFMEEKYHMGGLSRDGVPLKESHTDIVLDLLTLPSLEIVASASMDHTVRLWDMHTGKARKTLTGHTKGVRSMAYSPDYRFLVSAGFDYDALVWNPYVEKLILPLHGHNSSLCGVTIVPGTPQIITADTEGTFKLWDIRNFSCVQTFSSDDVDSLNSFVSVTKHRRLVSGGKRLHMFDYEKQENPELTDDTTVFAAGFNDTSNTFVTAAGRDVKVWSAISGGLLRRYRVSPAVDLTAFCLDGRKRKFVTGDHHGGVHVFDYLNGSHQKTLYQHDGEVTKLKYCARDKTVISASRDLTIVVSDESLADKGALLKEIKGGHTSEIGAMDFSCHLSLIASGCHDGLLCVWDYEFGKLSNLCLGHTSAITCVAFIEPLSLVAAADANGTVAIWAVRPSPRAGECVARFVNKVGDQMSNAGDDVEDGTAVPALQGSCAVMAMAADVTWVPAVPDAGTTAGNGGTGNSGEGDDASASGSAGAGAGAGASAGAGAGAGAGADVHRTPRRQSVSHGGDDSTATSPSAKGVPVVVLYTADDRGIIKKWSLTQLVRSMLQSGDVVHQVSPYPALFPRRNLLMDVSTTVANLKDTPSFRDYHKQRSHGMAFYVPANQDVATEADLELLRLWAAHSDAVYNIDVVNTPPALVTSSFDRVVRVWTKEGRRLATLQQGGVKLPWLFRVNNLPKIKDMENRARVMIKRIKDEIPPSETRRLHSVVQDHIGATTTDGQTAQRQATGAVPRRPQGPATTGRSAAVLRFQQRRAARLVESGASGASGASLWDAGRSDDPKAVTAKYYGAFMARRGVASGGVGGRVIGDANTGKRPGRRRRRGKRGKRSKASKPAVPKLDLSKAAKQDDGAAPIDMTADVLKDLTMDDDDDSTHVRAGVVALSGGPKSQLLASLRPPSPIRTAPRLTPITARTAGRGRNGTHQGRRQRATAAAWREHNHNTGLATQRSTTRTHVIGGSRPRRGQGSSLPPVAPQTARF